MASGQGSKGIPRRSRSEKAKAMRSRSWKAAQERKKENIAENERRRKANLEHKRSDPAGLTAYQRRKHEKNYARIVAKYGSYRPGVKVGGE